MRNLYYLVTYKKHEKRQDSTYLHVLRAGSEHDAIVTAKHSAFRNRLRLIRVDRLPDIADTRYLAHQYSIPRRK